MRVTTAVVLVVGMVALAGCSGGLIGGDEPTYPAGYNETGVTDTAQAFDTHTEAVGNRSGLNATLELAEETGAGSSQLSKELRVDIPSGQGYERLDTEQGLFETYRMEDGGTFYRAEVGDRVEYRYDESSEEMRTDPTQLLSVLEETTAASVEVSEEDGTSLIVFTFDESGVDLERVNGTASVEGELRIDEDGAIHSLTLSVSAEDGSSLSATVTNEFDQVTVDEPDWLDEARNETGQA